MNAKQKKKVILLGVILVMASILAIIHSLLFNEGRFIWKMDMSKYIFSVKDIPMLMILLLIFIYVIYIIVILVRNILSNKSSEEHYSRKLSPRLGICGVFGFAGFAGFWTYQVQGNIFPFMFFIFFGFFGFFFEGKLSHTLKDELYLENRRRASLKAYQIGFSLLFLVIWLVGMGVFSSNVEWCAIFMLISISLIYALVLFLSNYLLYRYEKEV